jgi:hypothetical protein
MKKVAQGMPNGKPLSSLRLATNYRGASNVIIATGTVSHSFAG